MSKNFELMQQVGEEPLLGTRHRMEVPFPKAKLNGNGHHKGTHLDLDQLGREESQRLVQRVFLSQEQDAPSTVVFAAIDHGNGCSHACVRVAETLANNVRGSICLVDANFRSPSLHRLLGVPDQRHGLIEALVEKGPIRSFTRELRPGVLSLLPCGAVEVDSPSLLNWDHLRTRLAELRAEYDYVLIDAPPLSRYADAITLGQLTDGLVLILEAHSTRRESALKVTENLRAAQVQVLGAVLNKRNFPIPASLYQRL
jgi:protein-tyrosine kinase